MDTSSAIGGNDLLSAHPGLRLDDRPLAAAGVGVGQSGVLAARELPYGRGDTDHAQARRDKAYHENPELEMQARPHQGIGLTCDSDGHIGWLPSGQLFLTCGLVAIALGAILAIRARRHSERILIVLSLAGLVPGVICGALVSYEVGCWGN